MLDSRPCGPERFQPFSLLPNTSSRCVTRKSQCNREGQVVYSNGTTTDDRSCRCNYIDNFVFVTKPKKKCYCIPSEEDCSCYSKACDVDYYLTPDYQCVHFSNWTGIFQCPAIQNEKIPNNGAPRRKIFITKSVPDSTYSTSKMNIYVKYLVAIVLVILLCTVFFLCGTYVNLQHGQEIGNGATTEMSSTQDKNKKSEISQFQIEQPLEQKTPIPQCDISTQGATTEMSSTQVKNRKSEKSQFQIEQPLEQKTPLLQRDTSSQGGIIADTSSSCKS
ncbi:uncharacterized protein LOC127716069 isoform X4 [Mytilus californianus]|uniref:uncharacterized protein LOC127716069 isoform X3 n=1 Tax=Mytilus californianus TaxID=6549 RepID=UPI0022453859|nr:uncharacterized protein LOC127716069 isoform X3 [Mytilus californianus]XP_052078368.1 uncharacterized protein LOC127716069 isoform X4 [Mytilus californianus]